MSSIEKMMFADIAGVDSDLDAVLEIISSCGCFHMENASCSFVPVKGCAEARKSLHVNAENDV